MWFKQFIQLKQNVQNYLNYFQVRNLGKMRLTVEYKTKSRWKKASSKKREGSGGAGEMNERQTRGQVGKEKGGGRKSVSRSWTL